jgi:low affinity Fe/Cu permease
VRRVSRYLVRPSRQVDLADRRTSNHLYGRCAYYPGLGCHSPIFGFSDIWQLVINTGTTTVTFLMVFLIQNTQNRDGAAIQLKLDELIRAVDGAHNGLLDLEELSDADLERIKKRFEALAREAREDLKRGVADTAHIDLRTD